MEYMESRGLRIRMGRSSQGISLFIQGILDGIPEDGAVSMIDMSKELMLKFPHIDKRQSYTRIGMVLGRAGNKGRFIKLTDSSDYLAIGWAKDHLVKVDEGCECDNSRHEKTCPENHLNQ